MHVKCIYIYAHVSSMSSDSTERTEVFVTYAKIQMEKKDICVLASTHSFMKFTY